MMNKQIREHLLDVEVQYEGGDGVAKANCLDEEDKCCICIDMKLGVKVLCVFGILGALGIFSGLRDQGTDFATVGIIRVVVGLPQLVCAWWFISWLKNEDTKETRETLVKAGKLQLVVILLQALVGMLDAMGLFGSYPHATATDDSDAAKLVLKTTLAAQHAVQMAEVGSAASSLFFGGLMQWYFVRVFIRFAAQV